MPGGAKEPQTSPKRLGVAVRRAEAVRLRLDGVRPARIAEILGYKNAHHVVIDLQRAIAAMTVEPTAELRRLEIARLDDMWIAVLDVLRREHLTVSHGKVIHLTDPNDPEGPGTPLVDDAPVLNAVDRLLKIQERRAKLLGLDAPTKIGVLDDDALDREEARLEAENADFLAQLDAGEAGTGPEDPESEAPEG
jgi:hypothetical protein